MAIGIGDAQGARAGCHQAGTGWVGTLPERSPPIDRLRHAVMQAYDGTVSTDF
jgi:hypothetical protein